MLYSSQASIVCQSTWDEHYNFMLRKATTADTTDRFRPQIKQYPPTLYKYANLNITQTNAQIKQNKRATSYNHRKPKPIRGWFLFSISSKPALETRSKERIIEQQEEKTLEKLYSLVLSVDKPVHLSHMFKITKKQKKRKKENTESAQSKHHTPIRNKKKTPSEKH